MLLFVLLALFSGHAVSYRFFHKSFTGSFSQQACKDGTLLAEVQAANNTCAAFTLAGFPANVFVIETPWVNSSFPGVYFEVSLSGCRGAPAGPPATVPYDFAIQLTSPLQQQCWYFLPNSTTNSTTPPLLPATLTYAAITMNTSFAVVSAQLPTINSIWSLLVPFNFQGIASSVTGTVLVSTFSGPNAGAAANKVAATLATQPDYLQRQVSSLPVVLSLRLSAASFQFVSVGLLMLALLFF